MYHKANWCVNFTLQNTVQRKPSRIPLITVLIQTKQLHNETTSTIDINLSLFDEMTETDLIWFHQSIRDKQPGGLLTISGMTSSF